MKLSIIAILLILVLIACKKSAPITEDKKENYFFRVAAPNGSTVDYSSVAIVKASTAGNGGQYAENNYASLEWSGYTTGYYVVNLKNKQQCGIDFTVSWLNQSMTVYVIGGATRVLQLPGTAASGEKIKAKPLYRCGSSGGDLGWIEIESPICLPVTFKYIRAKNIGNKQVEVSFEIAEASGVDIYWIQVSMDGINYVDAVKVESDKVIVDNPYTVTVNL